MPAKKLCFILDFLIQVIKKNRRDEFEKILFKWFSKIQGIKVFDPRDPLKVQKLS